MNLAAKRRVKARVAGFGRSGDGRTEAGAEAELVLRVRRLAGQLDEGGFLRALAGLLSDAAAHGPQIERAITAWVELIEQLVHDAEGRHPGPGLGAVKAAEVREAIRYLVGSGRLELPMPPGLPAILRPLAADIAARWVIDAIVALLNDHGGWGSPAPRPRTLLERALLGWRRRLRAAASSPPARLLRWLAARALAALSGGPPLSPEVRAALSALEEEGMLDHAGDALADVVRLTVSVGEHADAFLAGARLVGIVVEETERFTWLDGPGKRLAAGRLVTAVLQEVGLAPRGPAFTALLEAAVGVAIDSVVRVFNKRGLFVHA